MSDLTVAIGLVLVIEGLIWSLAPSMGMKMLAAAAATPPTALRLVGLGAVTTGVVMVWVVRG